MELKTFVAETIKEIIDGIAEAQDQVINRYNYSERGYVEIGNNSQHSISFDISVTSSQSDDKEGKAGVFIKVVDFGAKSTSKSSDSATNRIHFNVPIVYPTKANKKFS